VHFPQNPKEIKNICITNSFDEKLMIFLEFEVCGMQGLGGGLGRHY
jgi:hypothetical protein